MLAQSVFYNTKDLPSDILTLVDDRFYAFIEQLDFMLLLNNF